MDDHNGLLPASVRKQFQQSLAKCQSCLTLQEYLQKLGEADQETIDRANHLHAQTSMALALDREASTAK